MNEEDEEEMEKELREAFRLYDKEGECHNAAASLTSSK
jgi:Ca2+-binding EF-hand superfamily protein